MRLLKLPFSILLFGCGPLKAKNFPGIIQLKSPFSALCGRKLNLNNIHLKRCLESMWKIIRKEHLRVTAPHNAHIPPHWNWRNPTSQTPEPNRKQMRPMYCNVNKLFGNSLQQGSSLPCALHVNNQGYSDCTCTFQMTHLCNRKRNFCIYHRHNLLLTNES